MKEESKRSSSKIAVAVLLLLLIAVPIAYLSKKDNEEVESVATDKCMRISTCMRACVGMVDINNQELLEAKRIDKDEKDMLKERAKSNCQTACEYVLEQQ